MKIDELKEFNAAEYINSDEDRIEYLNLALENGNPAMMRAALKTVARSHGMTQLAKDTSLNRESLYKSLSSRGNPSFSSMLKILSALNLRLRVERVD